MKVPDDTHIGIHNGFVSSISSSHFIARFRVNSIPELTLRVLSKVFINIKKSYIFKAIYQFSKPDNLTQPKSGNSNQPEKRLLILLDVAKIYLSGETRDPQAIYSELFKAYTESDKGAQQFFTSINVVKFSKTDKDKVIQALKVADKEEVWSRLPSQILIDYLLGKISEKSDQYRKSLHKILKIIDPKGFSPALQGLYDAIKDRLAKDYPKKSLKNILAKGKGYQRKRPLVDLPEVEIIDKNPEDDKSVVNYFVHAFSLFEEQWKDIKTLNLTYENNIEYENNKSVYENWCADLWELITAIEAKKYSIQVTSTDWLSEVKEAYQQNFPYGRLFDRFSTISLTESNSEKNSDFAITSTKFNFGAGID